MQSVTRLVSNTCFHFMYLTFLFPVSPRVFFSKSSSRVSRNLTARCSAVWPTLPWPG